MAGYAVSAPLNLAGPFGTAAWLVVGTGLTIAAGVGMVKLSEELSNSRTRAPALPIPRTAEREKCKRYTVRVHAQGSDCGGTSGKTIGVPALTQPTPVTAVQGMGLSAGTKAMLGKRQLEARLSVIPKAERYITDGPKSGGRFGQKSFVVPGVRGGIRYDVDCFGDGPSFVS